MSKFQMLTVFSCYLPCSLTSLVDHYFIFCRWFCNPLALYFSFLCSLASLALSVELIALHKHKYQLVEVRYGISFISNLLLVVVVNVHDEHFYRTQFLVVMEHFFPQYWFRQSAWVCFIMIFLKAYFIAVGRTKCNMFL